METARGEREIGKKQDGEGKRSRKKETLEEEIGKENSMQEREGGGREARRGGGRWEESKRVRGRG